MKVEELQQSVVLFINLNGIGNVQGNQVKIQGQGFSRVSSVIWKLVMNKSLRIELLSCQQV